MCIKLLTDLIQRLHLRRYIMPKEIEYNEDSDLCAVEDEPGACVMPPEVVGDHGPVAMQSNEELPHPSEVIIGNFNLEQIGQAQARLMANKPPVLRASKFGRFSDR